MEFKCYDKCTLCPLHETANNCGISTRAHSLTGQDRAVLIVGEAPGADEDSAGTCWVGRTGKMLQGMIDISKIGKYADIYLANAARCRPPQNANPTTGNLNACRPYLQMDLDLLTTKYKEVIILCVGRYGVEAVTKQTGLVKCFSWQGQSLRSLNNKKKGGLTGDSPVFFTYHPAALFPNRQPGKVTAVVSHFTLLRRYLRGDFIPNDLHVVPEFNAPVPAKMPPLVAVDIETYGILRGKHQSVFIPTKSHYVDEVPLGSQIVTVAFGYVTDNPISRYRTVVYDWKKHRPQIRSWFRRIVQSGTTLLGQHIKYDVSYLKMNDLVLNMYLSPATIKLDDTLLASFLHYEQRPEKGLKELATLFGITDYSSLGVTAKGGRSKNASDPNLHLYNCTDVAATLALYYYTWEEIGKRYGENSYKHSEACSYMRNAILWDTIQLETSGIAMDLEKLKNFDNLCRKERTVAVACADAWGVIIQGEGSQKSTLNFMTECMEKSGMINDPRVKLTDKKKDISVGEDNFNLIKERYDRLDPNQRNVLTAMQSYHKNNKLVTSYTDKILHNKKEGVVHKNITYPQWYPMPSMGSKYGGGDFKVGGTLQGRFSCKKPAAQTYPPPIKKCISSRFEGGKVRVWDLSQIELRIAALLSGDPVMLREYEEGIDRHTNTALFFFPDADVTSDEFLRKPDGQRQCGKTTNFLVLYKGGAEKLQETIMKDLGIHVDLAICMQAIAMFDAKYAPFRAWQDMLINTVAERGYIELITGWSRFWGAGKRAASENINEICDFPIQTIAAQILQSSHFEIEKGLYSNGLRSLFFLQQHDSLFVDQYPGEEKIITKIVKKHLTSPPIFDIICNELGRTVPLEFEEETK